MRLPSGAGILLRTNALDTVEIDPTTRTARIGAGLWSGALQRAAAEHGLTARPGSSPVVTVAESAPEELTAWLELLNFPGADPLIAIDSTFLGNEDEARRLLRETDTLPAPLSDSRAAMSAAELGTITAEPTDPAPGRSRAELLTRFDDDGIDALVDDPIAPLAMVQIRQLGGALARASDSPHGALEEPYAAYMFGVPTASIAKIGRLKAERDPAGTIRGNFSVWD